MIVLIQCVITGKSICLRKILCKCDTSNTSSVTCDAALKLQTASMAIAVMPLKNFAFHGKNLHCRRALFLHARPKFLSQKGGNKIIKIAARVHGSAHIMNDACARCIVIQPPRLPMPLRQSLVGVKLYPPHKHSLGQLFKGTS